jgi:tRNA (Thr-GGU) A37 N-methylase
VENGRVEVGGIEAYPGTPVLDLQPYLPGVESRPGAVPPQRY